MSFLKMTRMEIKLLLLEPLSAFFTLAFPLLLLFVFGLIFGNDPFPGTTLGFLDIATPSYMAMIIGTTALMGIPVGLARIAIRAFYAASEPRPPMFASFWAHNYSCTF